VLEEVRRFSVPGGGPGIRISLLDWGGEGAPALLHHANGFCAALWDEVSRALRPRFRVFALDGRGYGQSSAPGDPEEYAWLRFADDVAAVAEALVGELGRPLALGLGHSFGGTATLVAAARRPELFEELVLVDPVVHAPEWSRQPVVSATAAQLAERARRRRRHWSSREEAARHFEARELFAAWTPRARALYVAHGLRDAEGGGVELACAPAGETSRCPPTRSSPRGRRPGESRRWTPVTSCRWSGRT
jgi:pimeloyl-ACP methyl ester carboxylesterase